MPQPAPSKPVPRVSMTARPWTQTEYTCPCCGRFGAVFVRTWTCTQSGNWHNQYRCDNCGKRWRPD